MSHRLDQVTILICGRLYIGTYDLTMRLKEGWQRGELEVCLLSVNSGNGMISPLTPASLNFGNTCHEDVCPAVQCFGSMDPDPD